MKFRRGRYGVGFSGPNGASQRMEAGWRKRWAEWLKEEQDKSKNTREIN